MLLCVGALTNTNIQGLVAEVTLNGPSGTVVASSRVSISEVSNVVLSSPSRREFSREYRFGALSGREDNGVFQCTITISHETITNFVNNGMGAHSIMLDVRGKFECQYRILVVSTLTLTLILTLPQT